MAVRNCGKEYYYYGTDTSLDDGYIFNIIEHYWKRRGKNSITGSSGCKAFTLHKIGWKDEGHNTRC
jgi:hypothetical protein